MNSHSEQRVNIKFCICLCKLATETIKLLREAYESECMTGLTIHKWHSRISKNLNGALLREKKAVNHECRIMETNCNTVRAVIDDNRLLFNRVIEALMIIHCILTEAGDGACELNLGTAHAHKRSNANPLREHFKISRSYCRIFDCDMGRDLGTTL